MSEKYPFMPFRPTFLVGSGPPSEDGAAWLFRPAEWTKYWWRLRTIEVSISGNSVGLSLPTGTVGGTRAFRASPEITCPFDPSDDHRACAFPGVRSAVTPVIRWQTAAFVFEDWRGPGTIWSGGGAFYWHTGLNPSIGTPAPTIWYENDDMVLPVSFEFSGSLDSSAYSIVTHPNSDVSPRFEIEAQVLYADFTPTGHRLKLFVYDDTTNFDGPPQVTLRLVEGYTYNGRWPAAFNLTP